MTFFRVLFLGSPDAVAEREEKEKGRVTVIATKKQKQNTKSSISQFL